MTEVIYKPCDFSLLLHGHAGYAEAGKDIVCAGLSALMFTIPASLKARGIRYSLDLGATDGEARLKAYPDADERYACMIIFETIAEGLALIAEHYPDNVKYSKEEK